MLCLLILVAACGSGGSTPATDALDAPDPAAADSGLDESTPPEAVAPDTAPDVAPPDSPAPDGQALDTGPEDPCAAPFADPIALYPGGPKTQIHVAGASDGASVWAAFSLPDVNGKFDTLATRIGCDGQVLVEPFLLHESPLYSEMDPAIAVVGGKVLVAWQQDTGLFPDNLSTYFRVFSADGELLSEAPVDLPTLAPGTAATANSWMPAVTATESGFVLATAAAVEGAQGFQVVLTGVSGDGTVAEEGTLAAFDPTASQVYPALAYHQGNVLVAWTRQVVEGDDKVQFAVQESSGSMLTPSDASALGTSFSGSVAGGDAAYLAFDSGTDGKRTIQIRSLTAPESPACELGGAGLLNHTPAVVSLAGQPAAIWYENQGGLKNHLYLQRCSGFPDSPAAAGALTKINNTYAAPYPAALTRVNDHVVFAAWSEGVSPDFEAWGRFVVVGE